MKPVSPVVPGHAQHETIIAKDQDEYGNMPALIDPEGIVLTRWELTEEEAAFIAEHRYFYHYQWTFHGPVQPIAMVIGEMDASQVQAAEPGDTNPYAAPQNAAQRPANASNGLSREQLADLLADMRADVSAAPDETLDDHEPWKRPNLEEICQQVQTDFPPSAFPTDATGPEIPERKIPRPDDTGGEICCPPSKC